MKDWVRRLGDRASVRFVNGERRSPCLYSHWGGMDFVKAARDFAKLKKKEMAKSPHPVPLEPGIVMLHFIRELVAGRDDDLMGDYCLGVDEEYWDNSDNGNFDIDLSLPSRAESLGLKPRK